MKLIIEISSIYHYRQEDKNRKEFYVKSFLTGKGDGLRTGDDLEECRSWDWPDCPDIQAIGLARLIELSDKIESLVETYSRSSSPLDWSICKKSSNGQEVS